MVQNKILNIKDPKKNRNNKGQNWNNMDTENSQSENAYLQPEQINGNYWPRNKPKIDRHKQ